MEWLQIPERVIDGFVNNLTEADIVKNKESGNTYVVAKHNPKTQDLIKKDASDDDIKKVEKGDDDKKKETKPKEKGKNKKLRDGANPIQNFNSKDEFTKTGISNEEFENNPNVIKNSEKDFKLSPEQIDKIFGKPLKFPKRYIKSLERLMSIQNKGNISITDVMKNVGAGELQAQAGEILTMMGSTIKDPEASKEFFNMLREYAKNADSPIITKAWVDSAEKVRGGIHKRLDAKYGEGNWEITSSGWDVESEVESMGMEDYKKNKGFSTDMYMVINGEDMDEVSLKKDLNANLLNATTGRVLDLIVQGNASDDELNIYNELKMKKGKTKEEKQQLKDIEDKYKKEEYGWDEDVDVKGAQRRQRDIHNETMGDENFINEVKGDRELTDDEIKEIASPMGISQRDKDKVANFIKNDIPKILEKIESPITRDKLKSTLKELGLKNNTRAVGKAAIILMKIAAKKNPNSKAAKGIGRAVENSKGHSKAVAQLIIKSPEVKKGLLKSIRESLPLGALMSGEESMHLADQALDQEVLSTIFGVSSMKELESGLTLNEEGDAIVYQIDIKNPDPPPEMIKEDIPIATVTNRPDGVAYGETWKLEFKVHPIFKKEVKEANNSLGRI
jgi:hypothetical protein